MVTRTSLWTAAAAVVLLLAPALAGAQANNPTGVAVGYGIGPSTIEDEDGPDATFDGSDLGWNLDIEWRFIEYLAIGMNVTSLGQDTDDVAGTATTIDVDGFGFYLRGYWPVSERVTLHARYGETNYSVDIDPGVGTAFPFNSESAKDFGFGGDYYFNDRFAARFEARWLDGPNKEAGSLITLGLRWQF